MADDKVTPEQAPEQEPVNPVIENDPEVLAEVKKSRILHLKLERWKDTAMAIGVVLQTLKAEMMSLMSGIGTAVVAWFQIRKSVVKGRAELKATERSLEVQTAVKGGGRLGRREQMEGGGAGQGYGSGQGSLAAQKPRSPKPEPAAPGEELVGVPDLVGAVPEHSMFADPMNYATVLLPVIFIWSTIVAWVKRRRKNKEKSNA